MKSRNYLRREQPRWTAPTFGPGKRNTYPQSRTLQELFGITWILWLVVMLAGSAALYSETHHGGHGAIVPIEIDRKEIMQRQNPRLDGHYWLARQQWLHMEARGGTP